MDDKEILDKVILKKEFSQLPKEDIDRAYALFKDKGISELEKVKRTRNLLRTTFSGFGGNKLVRRKDIDKEEILKKHISTRERYDNYEEVYGRILKSVKNKEISIIDLGAGVNGFSYNFFKKIGFGVDYYAIEAVGQFVELMNRYFEIEKIRGKAFHISLFNKDKVIEIINEAKNPKVIFMFKIIDSLEALERNYSMELLNEIKNKCQGVDKIVFSYATRSWYKRKKFYVKRNWIIDFIRENFDYIDDFEEGGERYLVFRNKE